MCKLNSSKKNTPVEKDWLLDIVSYEEESEDAEEESEDAKQVLKYNAWNWSMFLLVFISIFFIESK